MYETQSKRVDEWKLRQRSAVLQQLADIEAALADVPLSAELLENLRRIATTSTPADARRLLSSVQQVLGALQ
ncbi:hypothetical protein ACSMEB_17140 [Stenotrophomonas maltophilia]